MLSRHLVYDGLDEVDVAVAPGVPCPVDSVGKDTDELGGVANGFHAHVVVLELVELHPVSILVIAVTENEQRTVLTKVLWHNDVVRAAGAVDGDVVGLCRYYPYDK